MRTFDYDREVKKLLTPNIVSLLTKIHEYRGEQTLFVSTKSDTLTDLVKIAKIQSTESSNIIEGIRTSSSRLKQLVEDKTMPESRDEKEIAGYRDVLNTIHENYMYIPVKSSIILQLHRDLYKYSGTDIGGNYKASDNVITEKGSNGEEIIRFRPLPSWQTTQAMDALCDELNKAFNNQEIDNLLSIAIFILDFLCIHPFSDGNGRMSRLLTLLLLYKSGYIIGKYISIEKLIEQSKETYYETLYDCSIHWHEGENDYTKFIEYLLGIVLAAYKDFSSRIISVSINKLSKPERIANMIENTLGSITKSEILQSCPDISEITVKRAIIKLLNENKIIKHGGGRYTSYTWNREG